MALLCGKYSLSSREIARGLAHAVQVVTHKVPTRIVICDGDEPMSWTRSRITEAVLSPPHGPLVTIPVGKGDVREHMLTTSTVMNHI